MKHKLHTVFILLFCLIPCSHLSGQEKQAKDKYTLLTMPYNQRPLTLYKGQLQINAGYQFAVRSKSYDADGEKISLKTDGSASVMHTYIFELKYGITDYIEFGINSYYLRNGIRSESGITLSGNDAITTNTLNEYKGFGDLTLAAAFRIPIEYKSYDVSLKGGITLPSAEHQPSMPTHAIADYVSPKTYTVNYHFNNNNGIGVPLYLLAGSAKITLSKISVEARGSYSFPSKEGESVRWNWTLSGSKFTYSNIPYNYLPDRTLSINGSLHYQAAGWLDLFLSNNYSKRSSGWTEYYNLKYANPETSLVTVEPGFELQVSPSLTIYQYAGFHLAGVNSDAPFYLFTTLSFNMFPFLK